VVYCDWLTDTLHLHLCRVIDQPMVFGGQMWARMWSWTSKG